MADTHFNAVADTAQHLLPDFAGDVIVVTGQMMLYQEKLQIVVTEAMQVKVEQ